MIANNEQTKKQTTKMAATLEVLERTLRGDLGRCPRDLHIT